MEKQTIGDRIKSLRRQKRYSQQKLADLAGLDLSTIRKLESNDRHGKPDTHQKVAEVLGVSVSFLVYGNEEPDEPGRKLLYWLEANTDLSATTKKSLKIIIETELAERREQGNK
jgi:transcriptional regulator with XRE-family HTH domain